MSGNNKLTTQEYWESYYGKDHADARHIISVCSYYDRYWDELIQNDPSNKTIIEIGGFPGRYLAYLASKYNLIPTCLDYNSDKSQIERTFDVMKVDNFHILQEDFTAYKPQKTYDYVISNGFIEHFEDFDNILDKHMQYLKPGGKMLIMIPNMRGYIKWYKRAVDPKNLSIHNLKSMSLRVFRDFGKRHDLMIEQLEYFGDFPHTVHQPLNVFQKLIFKANRLLFKKGLNPLVRKYPSKMWSSSMIAIYKNPES